MAILVNDSQCGVAGYHTTMCTNSSLTSFFPVSFFSHQYQSRHDADRCTSSRSSTTTESSSRHDHCCLDSKTSPTKKVPTLAARSVSIQPSRLGPSDAVTSSTTADNLCHCHPKHVPMQPSPPTIAAPAIAGQCRHCPSMHVPLYPSPTDNKSTALASISNHAATASLASLASFSNTGLVFVFNRQQGHAAQHTHGDESDSSGPGAIQKRLACAGAPRRSATMGRHGDAHGSTGGAHHQ